jgi:hypothetical protein
MELAYQLAQMDFMLTNKKIVWPVLHNATNAFLLPAAHNVTELLKVYFN